MAKTLIKKTQIKILKNSYTYIDVACLWSSQPSSLQNFYIITKSFFLYQRKGKHDWNTKCMTCQLSKCVDTTKSKKSSSSKVGITWSRFAEMKFQPMYPGRISHYYYMAKSFFILAMRDRYPPGICLQKTINSHWLKNVQKMMKFYKDICLLFSPRLTSYVS